MRFLLPLRTKSALQREQEERRRLELSMEIDMLEQQIETLSCRIDQVQQQTRTRRVEYTNERNMYYSIYQAAQAAFIKQFNIVTLKSRKNTTSKNNLVHYNPSSSLSTNASTTTSGVVVSFDMATYRQIIAQVFVDIYLPAFCITQIAALLRAMHGMICCEQALKQCQRLVVAQPVQDHHSWIRTHQTDTAQVCQSLLTELVQVDTDIQAYRNDLHQRQMNIERIQQVINIMTQYIQEDDEYDSDPIVLLDQEENSSGAIVVGEVAEETPDSTTTTTTTQMDNNNNNNNNRDVHDDDNDKVQSSVSKEEDDPIHHHDTDDEDDASLVDVDVDNNNNNNVAQNHHPENKVPEALVASSSALSPPSDIIQEKDPRKPTSRTVSTTETIETVSLDGSYNSSGSSDDFDE